MTSDSAAVTCVAQLREVLVQRERAGRALIRRVHVDHVDVGREVQLLAAELAHADHGERRVALDAVVIDVARRAVARAQLAIVERDRRVEAHVGEARQLAADLGIEPELELADAEPDQLVARESAAARPSAPWRC